MKQELKAYARSLGLAAVGVSSAEPFWRERQLLLSRQQSGFSPPLSEDEIERRCTPERSLPGARSILAAALSYFTDRGGGEELQLARPPEGVRGGRIARYARGRDYHAELRERLEHLASFLREVFPGARYAIQVDTGPLLDRAVAVRAGLGWYGKNGLVIVPGEGSWVALGEIVTDAPLEPDAPVQDSCGNCRRCLEACPTGALEAPYTVDTKRCVARLSQTRGYIPQEFRVAMGNRLFGCDACQEVCPHNCPREDPDVDLAWVIELGRTPFREAFGESAAAWRGRATMQRNALVALANVTCAEVPFPGRPPVEAEQLLASGLQDDRPVIRGHAAWALGRTGGWNARIALRARLAAEGDPGVQGEIRQAVRKLAREEEGTLGEELGGGTG